jgi:tRNA threonylcarbamoyladenosine biosynthesis protein TsaB
VTAAPLLVIDTCLAACQAAVLRADGSLVARSEPMERGHQERLAGLVAETLAEAGLAFPDLSRLGVTVGPGSFTGLRVGLAFAKGLATALRLPLVGIGTLEALAAGQTGLAAAVLDARRDQVHLQAFEDGVSLAPPQAIDLDEAARRLTALGTGRLIGPGAILLAGRLPDWRIEVTESPDIATVAGLVAAADPAAAPPAPLYLRGAYA